MKKEEEEIIRYEERGKSEENMTWQRGGEEREIQEEGMKEELADKDNR